MQQRRDAGQVQEQAAVLGEGAGRVAQRQQVVGRVGRALGAGRQSAPYVQHRARQRIAERARRQDEAGVGAGGALSAAVGRHQMRRHLGPGPGIGGQIHHRDAARLGRRSAQRDRHRQHPAVSVRACQGDPRREAPHAIALRRRPGQSRPPGKRGVGTGRGGPGHLRTRARLDLDAPVRQTVTGLGDAQPGAGRGGRRQRPVERPAPLRQPGEDRVPVQPARQARRGVGSGQADGQARAGRHDVMSVRIGQEHRRAAGIVRRGDPGLQGGRRPERQRDAGPESGGETERRVAAGQQGRHQERGEQRRRRAVSVAAAQRQQRPPGLQTTEPGPGASQMRLPEQGGWIAGAGQGRPVVQRRERAMRQARGLLDAPVAHRSGRTGEPAHAAAQQQRGGRQHQDQRQRVQPGRQALRHGEQGQHRIDADHREGGQSSRPELLDPQHQPGTPTRRVERAARRPRARQSHVNRSHVSQSGTISPSQSRSTGCLARITLQRSPSTSAWAARGRAL